MLIADEKAKKPLFVNLLPGGLHFPLKHPRYWQQQSTREQSSGLTNPSQTALEFFMTQVNAGDTVRIHYKGTLNDGTIFDSSEGREPLEFVVGSGQIIPGLDVALTGMSVGEKKTVTIDPENAYGPIEPAARQAVPRAEIPADIPLELGMQLQVQTPDGHAMPVTVVELTDDSVTLDANHPLAGQDLTFDFELVSIN